MGLMQQSTTNNELSMNVEVGEADMTT